MATLKTKIQLRRDTAENLKDVKLGVGEPGYATDTKKFVIGDNSTKFSDLKGRVMGPNTATDNALAKFDGTSGQVIQNSNATLSDAGQLKVVNWKDERYASNVAMSRWTTTAKEIIIYTKIKFVSSAVMPIVRLHGYAYGQNAPIELKIGFYIYNSAYTNMGAVSMGAWRPEIRLFKYTASDSVDYVAIGFIGTCYYGGFQVDVQAAALGTLDSNILTTGWSVSTFTTEGNVPAIGTDKSKNVPYKSTLANLTINGTIYNGSSDVTLNLATDDHTHDEYVVGPESATGNAITIFDGTTGKKIKNSGSTIDSNGYITTPRLLVTANNNTLTIGSQNASFCHIYNSADIPFIFNQGVQVTGNKDLGTSQYDWKDLYLSGAIKKVKSTTDATTYTLSLPNKTGTVALTSDIPSLDDYVEGPSSSTDNAIARYNGTTGKIIQNSNATVDDNGIVKAAGFGDGTITIKPHSSNEVNFGGTNTDTTIYFGHRATDSRPKPTLYVFGGTAADASIQANKFIKTSSSDNYVLLGGGGHKAISDFALDSEIPDPTDYYWANVKVSTSSSTSTKPTFANNFLVNIATNNVLTPGADWAIASAIPKYLWHDLLPFRTAKAEYSTNGTTWTEDTTDTYRRTLTNQKENQTITVLSDSRPYARFTWDGGSAIWHACQADWLVIGFAYASPAATCSIKFQYSTDGTTWIDSLTVGSSSYNSSPSWFKINSSFSSCRAVRLVLTRTNSSGTLNLSSVKWLTKRWGNQGMGSELEKPYSWDNNANLYYRNSTSTLGLSSAPWSAIYGTTIYEGGTSLSSKYQPKDDDLTAIAALTGTSGFLKKTAANTWALDTNTYLTSEADTLQTVTNRGATTTKAITTAGLTTTSGYVNITGTSSFSEGIRLHPVGNLSSVWWNATTDKDYCTNGMWGITAYDYGYSDTAKKNTFRFRGPTSATATSPTDQMWIDSTGLVTSRGGFAKSGSSDSYILLAGGGTKAVSDFQANGNYVTYTQNSSVSVAGTTKTTYTYGQTAIFAPNGLIMGGTAAAAGLVTRGICGVSTPNSTTGACTKDNLYLNFDGGNTTTWSPTTRGVIINAGTPGNDLGSGMYQYCAVRGDIVKAWVEAKGYITSSSLPTVNNGTLTIQRNGTTVATFTANQAGNTTANITDSDTLNTAGSTNDEAKLYLVGAKSQATSAQTFSDAEVYTQAGELNATSVCVAEHGQMKYDSATQCIRFVIV